MLTRLILAPRFLGPILALLCLSAVAPSHAQTGPIAWWKLDEGTGTSTADASGNGNSGTLVDSPAWVAGRVGPAALSLPGTTSYVRVTNSGNLNNLYQTGMTVTAWINPAAAGGGGRGRIIDFDNNTGGWFFCMYTSSTIQFLADEFANNAAYRISTAGITLNSWQHVAATWDGSASGSHIQLYINGVAAVSTDASTMQDGTGAESGDVGVPFYIGNRQVDTARGFNGSIDDVRVYNRVLSLAEIQALSDSTPPSAPSGLGATAASSAQINLSWTASTDNVGVTGYLLERCQGSGCASFTQIATPTGTSYSDTSLTASTNYSYRVRATDANSNLSTYSSTVSATTSSGSGDTTPPSAPTGLTATVASGSQVNLTWTASTDNVGVTGYRIERCQGSGCSNFTQIATTTGTSYSDTGLTASTSYTYRVRATDASSNLSAYSSLVSVSTPAGSGDTQPPTAPTNLAVLASSSSEVDLNWGAATDNVGVTAYLIERCSTTGCSNFAQLGSTPTSPFYDATVAPSTTYSYRARAQDGAGNTGPYSNVITTTTPASSPDCN